MSLTAVQMIGVTKRYARVLANDGADFSVDRGEIHALVGENGAGKTTLVRILSGSVRPDAGSIALFGQRVRLRSPRDAIAAGVGIVHQHASVVPTLTVAENVVLGAEPVTRGLLDERRARTETSALAAAFDLPVDADVLAGGLGVGEQQRVEILRVLRRRARILVLDEPTAVLTPLEVAALFRSLRSLRAGGAAIVLVTHRLEEVMQVSDRVTVMRAGKTITTRRTSETSADELGRTMLGPLDAPRAAPSAPRAAPDVLRLESITVAREGGGRALDGVNLSVCAHEIVGVAGVAGNGQNELVEVAAGLRPPDGGRVWLRTEEMTGRPRAAFVARRVAFVPEDRLDRGLVAGFTLAENLLLGRERRPDLSRVGVLARRTIRDLARARLLEHDVRPPDPDALASDLSGGNQQKLLAARELHDVPLAAVVAQPTRGADLRAAASIHARLAALAEAGAAILLVSAELDELLVLAHRIVVLYRGRVAGELPASEASAERLGPLMLGTPT